VARNHADWLAAYIDYASYTEAPRRMHFWCGVAAVAGALRRRVWIDQAYFKWHTNSYIILVAPPGIVSKSTTANVAMRLLRQVPGVKFGPDVVTWQALVGAFAEAQEAFELGGVWHPMSAITIESSEFGNLLNPQDKDMVDLLVNLWDGKQGAFEKRTKMSGNDTVINPWINLIACTTPAWIAGNFPEYMIGGGFTSRCLFVYADEKEKYVAYPGLIVPDNQAAVELSLVQDLEHISMTLCGEYRMTADAVKWGELWYRRHYAAKPFGMEDDRFGGYLARKQTHIHKLAMILSASKRDALTITDEDLILANDMVSDLEREMPKVFSKIGRSDMSVQTERLLGIITSRGPMPQAQAYKSVHSYFPSAKEFADVLEGMTKAGLVTLYYPPGGSEMWVRASSAG
jgi:hypothetical protein